MVGKCLSSVEFVGPERKNYSDEYGCDHFFTFSFERYFVLQKTVSVNETGLLKYKVKAVEFSLNRCSGLECEETRQSALKQKDYLAGKMTGQWA